MNMQSNIKERLVRERDNLSSLEHLMGHYKGMLGIAITTIEHLEARNAELTTLLSELMPEPKIEGK